ncbi:Uncharacterised protein [Yersinia frederiksenii]|nr:Uncharacterised protein [Yersinia frederiksenii]CNJ07561.1 Uncharacterised protein [Yersinia frederiksenii]CNK42066.1 Uncharacterised protein [Yersinia frederiksenii]
MELIPLKEKMISIQGGDLAFLKGDRDYLP